MSIILTHTKFQMPSSRISLHIPKKLLKSKKLLTWPPYVILHTTKLDNFTRCITIISVALVSTCLISSCIHNAVTAHCMKLKRSTTRWPPKVSFNLYNVLDVWLSEPHFIFTVTMFPWYHLFCDWFTPKFPRLQQNLICGWCHNPTFQGVTLGFVLGWLTHTSFP
jgi:hypothetical protein